MIAFATFVVATGLTVALGALVRRTAPTLGAVVPPRPDRWHSRPTPTMGGVAFTAAVLAPLCARPPPNHPHPARLWLAGPASGAARAAAPGAPHPPPTPTRRHVRPPSAILPLPPPS